MMTNVNRFHEILYVAVHNVRRDSSLINCKNPSTVKNCLPFANVGTKFMRVPAIDFKMACATLGRRSARLGESIQGQCIRLRGDCGG